MRRTGTNGAAGGFSVIREILHAHSGVHFIGIGGIGMSGVAKCLLSQGVQVTGSDAQTSATTDQLSALGARIRLGHDSASIHPGLSYVVYSAAVRDDNPELSRAKELGVPTLKYAQMLGRLLNEKDGIAVSGCHGKTTTTGMISHVLTAAGLDPTYVIGGHIPCLGGSSRIGQGRFFVAEACEYDRSFHNFSPKIAVVNNVDADHLDYYRDIEEIIESFARFVATVPEDGLIVVSADDEKALRAVREARSRVVTFGQRADADWTARDVRVIDGRWEFEAQEHGARFARMSLRVPGRHNIANALATCAVAHQAGVAPEAIAEALAGFGGAARRIERLAEAGGVVVIDDYAHHPTEIRAVLRTLREMFPGRALWAVFQPHQASRTKALLGDFAEALTLADRVFLPDIYAARDREEDLRAVSSADLAAHVEAQGGKAEHVGPLLRVAPTILEKLKPGTVVVTMGAGDVWRAAHAVAASLPQAPVQQAV